LLVNGDTLSATSGSSLKLLHPLTLPDGSVSSPGLSFTSDPNTGVLRSSEDTLDLVTGGVSRLRVDNSGQLLAVYKSTVGDNYGTTLHNGYLCRAWVNFNGAPTTGTYVRTGTTVVCTVSSHGLSTGQVVSLDFTTGTATDGSYVVTVTGTGTFEVTDSASGSTSGNVTVQIRVRASGNVSSITDNGTGDYTVNFTNTMPDANYALCAISGNASGNIVITYSGFTYTASACRILLRDNLFNLTDMAQVHVGVFR